MNREQMVERAAAVLFEIDGGTWPEDCTHPDEHRRDARAVLDVILPQVSTVEQMWDLLTSVSENAAPTVVIDAVARPWTLFEDDRGDFYAQRLGDQDEPAAVTLRVDADDWSLIPGPLTVVYQPEVPA